MYQYDVTHQNVYKLQKNDVSIECNSSACLQLTRNDVSIECNSSKCLQVTKRCINIM